MHFAGNNLDTIKALTAIIALMLNIIANFEKVLDIIKGFAEDRAGELQKSRASESRTLPPRYGARAQPRLSKSRASESRAPSSPDGLWGQKKQAKGCMIHSKTLTSPPRQTNTLYRPRFRITLCLNPKMPLGLWQVAAPAAVCNLPNLLRGLLVPVSAGSLEIT